MINLYIGCYKEIKGIAQIVFFLKPQAENSFSGVKITTE